MAVPLLPATGWDELLATIAAELAALPDRGFVVVTEPVVEPPRAGGLRGLLGRPRPAPTRFVQALRTGPDLTLECVGAASFGGPVDLDEATDARLRGLGWPAPGDPGYEPMGGPAYRRWVPAAEVDAAAELLVASLEALGLSPGGPLELQRG